MTVYVAKRRSHRNDKTVHLGPNALLPDRAREAAVHQKDPLSRHPVDGGGKGLIYLGPGISVSNNSIDK